MEDVAPAISTSFGFGPPATTDRLSPTLTHTPSMTPPTHPRSASPSPSNSNLLSASTPMTNQQVTQLIEDIRHADLQVRLNSFRKIQVIAQALGQQRTRTELIPYLGEFCDDEDEVLLILASMLGEMVDAVGGSEYAYVLLGPLEQLAGSEETAVREKAVGSLGKIIEQVNENVLLDSVLPLLRRCANADWFTSRISATALFPLIYPRLPNADENIKREMRNLYANLCKKEETPMVKRAAAANLGAFASILDSATLMTEFHSLLVKLSRDEIDSVRLLIVQSCVQILKVYVKEPATRNENVAKMKPIILSLADDSSWRVRYMLADKFIELCSTIISATAPSSSSSASSHTPSVSPPILTPLRDDDLIGCFMQLLDDPELEVRTSATLKCGEFARLLGAQKTMEKFFWIGANGKLIQPLPLPPTPTQATLAIGAPHPPLKSIILDPTPGSLHTKSALASVILQFTSVLAQPIVGPNSATPTASSPNNLIIEHLLPLILSLLADENAEVRLGIIAKLGEEGAQVGSTTPLTIEVLSSSLLPALAKLAADPKWRVRLQTIQLLPSLAAFFQQELFHAKLFDTVLGWLGDSIWSIREAAIQNLVRLTQLFGREWGATRLLPKMKALAGDKSYVFRLTAVFGMKDLAALLGAEVVTRDMRPMLLTNLSVDPVPNVRFNVARLLGYLVKDGLIVGADAIQSVERVLLQMREDPDADVKYCAQQALKEAFPQRTTQPMTM